MLAALTAASLAGCGAPGTPTGTGSDTASGTGTAPATGTATTPPAAGSGGPTGGTSGCRSGTTTLTEADQGRSTCVVTGTRVEVYLHNAAGSTWSPIELSGTALRPAASGKGTLPVGVVAGFFVAVAPGTATLASHRPACPSPTAGAVSCMAIIEFTVSVTVR